jgi:hypothetical protein
LLLWPDLKFDSFSRAALLAEITSLPFEAEAESFVENVGKRCCFSSSRIDRPGISGADLSAKTTSYASLPIDAPMLLNYFDAKTAQFAAKSLDAGIGQNFDLRMSYRLFDFIVNYAGRTLGADIRCLAAKRGAVPTNHRLLLYQIYIYT